ncbi:MAG: UDP-2,3-diacylglucosamine diphosphatase LpxI [Candidatus Riflebacteria bacterium]|nr:UDP-2,3-diacylglucosamine diphosphatase LpxI [Candidatus Riflebacteria bacterium]
MTARHEISPVPRSGAQASERSGVRERLGLIAGCGRFPISLARAARDHGYDVVAVAIEGEASLELAQHVDRIHWLGVGSLTQAIETFRAEGVRELVMAGKVQKQRIFDLRGVDARLVSAMEGLPARGDDAVLRAIAAELERGGLKVRESSSFLGPALPQPGVLSRRSPLGREDADIVYGLAIARQLATLGIGQTVVVKDRVIVAVEAIEGTDATIARAGACCGPGTVVVKVSGPSQDTRFDLPVVGPMTIAALAGARASVLAVEAGRTVVLDRAEVVLLADEAGIAVVAV